MFKLGILLALCFAVPSEAVACREALQTHEARIEAADVAFVARVSSVSIPQLERDDYDDSRAWPLPMVAPRDVRVVVLRTLKGTSAKHVSVSIVECRGAAYANLGDLVRVYRINGEWWLDEIPKS